MMTPNTGRRRPTLAECTAAANRRLKRFKCNGFNIEASRIRIAELDRIMDAADNRIRAKMQLRAKGFIIARLGK